MKTELEKAITKALKVQNLHDFRNILAPFYKTSDLVKNAMDVLPLSASKKVLKA